MQHINDNYYSQKFNIIMWVTVSQKNYIPSMLAHVFGDVPTSFTMVHKTGFHGQIIILIDDTRMTNSKSWAIED